MSGRISQIDGLRGLAAFLVLGFHLTTRYDQLYGHIQHIPINVPWGRIGVHLFFAISGFVILMTLRKVKAPMDFAVSRFSRLYPTYWVCMLLTAVLLAIFPLPDQPVSLGQVAGNFLMFHGIFGVHHVNGTYWTLEVELIFYVLMLLLWTMGALKRPLLPVIAWLALSLLSRFVPVPWFVMQLALLYWLPWFGIGIAVYVLAGKHEDYKLAPIALVLSAGSIAMMEGVWYVAWAFGVAAILYLAAIGKLKGASSKVFLFLGAISYPLYLLHEYLGYTFMRRVEAAGLHSAVAVLIAAVGCIGLAYLIHRFAEDPSMKWVRERYKKRTGPSNLKIWGAGLVSALALLAIVPRLM
jgi:peptidoglycan/LPS O-acetylase OafA/YrhL